MIGHLCPLIQSIKTKYFPKANQSTDQSVDHPQTIEASNELSPARLELALDAYPLSDSVFAHLVKFSVTAFEQGDSIHASLYYLMFLSKLQPASRLMLFELAGRIDDRIACFVEYILLRSLPQLDHMMTSVYRFSTAMLRFFYVPEVKKCIELTRVPSSVYVDQRTYSPGPSRMSNAMSIDELLESSSKPLNEHVIIANSHKHFATRHYQHFRRAANDAGLDGRAEFMIYLLQHMSEKEQDALDAWDAGNLDQVETILKDVLEGKSKIQKV